MLHFNGAGPLLKVLALLDHMIKLTLVAFLWFSMEPHISHISHTYISKHEKFVARNKYIISIHGVLANGPLNPSFNLHSEDQWVNPPMMSLYLVSDSASSSTISGVSGAEVLLPFLPKRDKEIWLIEKVFHPLRYMNSSYQKLEIVYIEYVCDKISSSNSTIFMHTMVLWNRCVL